MTITKLFLKHFTAFEKLDLQLSSGINVFVGENGTGKTHLMKVIYAACDITKNEADFADKLNRVFLPSGRVLGRLVKRERGTSNCAIKVSRDKLKIRASFNNRAKKDAKITGKIEWNKHKIECVFIPVKEMLSNAPGFRSLYEQREIHFEEIYRDIIDRAYLPVLRGPIDKNRKKLLNNLKKVFKGTVVVKNQEFFLGNLEFTLLAEGIRKLCLLWLLIQNGTLMKGSVLFWDEPETNLNPKLFRVMIDILLELQRHGVQVFLATHDYMILKELDLEKESTDKISYYSLYRDKKTREIVCHAADRYLDVHPNAIADTFADLYDREVTRSLGGLVK